MKRSEMWEKLYNLLYASNNIVDPSGQSNYKALAEEVLFEIEKLGMMPPIIEEQSFKILDNGEMTYAVHEWEPE